MQILVNDLDERIVGRMVWALIEGSEQVAIHTLDGERLVVNANEVKVRTNPVDGHQFLVAFGTFVIYFNDLLTVESYRER